MLNIKNLKDVAEVVAGYTFRTAIQDDKDGKINILQAKNIAESNYVDLQDLPKINLENLRTTAFIELGDVLLSSRGSFRAGVYKGDLRNVLASASLYILRIKSKEILPEYLSIYLNSKLGQSQIKKIITGTIIKTILRRELEGLKIVIPTIERQKQLIEIHSNWKEREALLNRKIQLNQNIAEEAINHILTH